MKQPPLKIAIAGLGNVGAGVAQWLIDESAFIATKANRPLEIIAVSARTKNKERGFNLSGITWCYEPLDLLKHKPDILCELIGGEEGTAFDLVKAALRQKIAVVTANKALLAKHGITLARIAEETNTPLAFEAAVAGGIPIIKLLREGLSANKILFLYGILNGTCNYILTTMQSTGRDFNDVLKEAQDKGYAESDPTLDVDGFDTAHKLSLLTALAYGVKPSVETMSVSGIRAIKADDIRVADELGYTIKLLGRAFRAENGDILQIVEPSLVPKHSPLAHVTGVLNAIYTDSVPVGRNFIEGRGAGAGPTASAVISDIIDLANGRVTAPFLKPVAQMTEISSLADEQNIESYYLRLMVKDQPGVIADVAAILRDHHISIESLIQRGRDPTHPVMVVITTHECSRAHIASAVDKINKLDSVDQKPLFMPLIKL